MSISSIATKSFPQMNADVSRTGEQKATAISQKAASYYKVSPFGDETKIGTHLAKGRLLLQGLALR